MRPSIGTSGGKAAMPLKVLFITHSYIRRSGDFAGVFLHLLARKLREYDIEVTVVAPHDAGIPEHDEIDGIKIHRFRYASEADETLAYRGNMHRQLFHNPFKIFTLRRFLKAAQKMAADLIEKENITVVSVHWMIPSGLVGYRLKRKFGDRIRLFVSSHGTDVRLVTCFYPVFVYFKRVIRRLERWTVVSNFLKRLVLERDIYLGDKIDVIPLPNDENLFYPDHHVVEDPNLVVAVSRLTVQKRLHLLIRAFKNALAEKPHLKLEIYGTGPEKEHLLSLLDELGVSGRVTISDPVAQKDLRKIYTRAAVVVLNSVDEGFGLVLTEAMLCRTAVIGAESGGITDIIDDNETGLFVTEDNTDELAAAILRLANDPGLRDRLAEAGYRKARENFSASSSARRFAALFKFRE